MPSSCITVTYLRKNEAFWLDARAVNVEVFAGIRPQKSLCHLAAG